MGKEGSDKTLQSEPSQNACAFSIVNSFELIIKIRACLIIKRVCNYQAELNRTEQKFYLDLSITSSSSQQNIIYKTFFTHAFKK